MRRCFNGKSLAQARRLMSSNQKFHRSMLKKHHSPAGEYLASHHFGARRAANGGNFSKVAINLALPRALACIL